MLLDLFFHEFKALRNKKWKQKLMKNSLVYRL